MSSALMFDDVHLSEPIDKECQFVKFDYGEISTIGVIEMLLKDREGLDRMLRDAERQRELIPRLLAVALIGFTIYGVIATALLLIVLGVVAFGAVLLRLSLP